MIQATETVFVLTAIHERPHLLRPWVEQFECVADHFQVRYIIIDSSKSKSSSDALDLLPREVRMRVDCLRVPPSYYWARSISTAMDKFQAVSKGNDHVLLCNDDVRIASENIVELVNAHRPKTARSAISEREETSVLRLTWDRRRLKLVEPTGSGANSGTVKTDFLSGRCVLLDGDILRSAVRPRWRLLPQHYADFDYFNRLKCEGIELFVHKNIRYVDAERPSLLGELPVGWKARYFSPLSGERLLSKLGFYIPLILRSVVHAR